MKKRYLIRLDDACPTMKQSNWRRIESLLDRFGIKPLVGVIPKNEDLQQLFDESDDSFWDTVRRWESKGWTIALHGYNHCYSSGAGLQGLNPMWRRSEFAGVPLELQKAKIRKGLEILASEGVNPSVFFAPSHTFDENTLCALREESDIRIISDTVATHPYCFKDFIFIPQIVGRARKMLFPGIYTFCYHPNTMQESDFLQLETFISNNLSRFLLYQEIDVNKVGEKSGFDKVLTRAFFLYRSLRNLQ